MSDGAQFEVGVKLGGDSKELVDASKAGLDAQKALEEQYKRTGEAARKAQTDSQLHVQQMKEQERAASSLNLQQEAMAGVLDALPPKLRMVAGAFGITGTAIAATGVLVAGAVSRWNEWDGYLRKVEASLIAQGRGAEISRDQVSGLVKEVAQLPGMNRDAAAGVVASYTQMRDIGGRLLGDLSKLTRDYAAATGRDVPAAAAELGRAFADPGKGARDLDRQLNILSASQVIAIQNFSANGQQLEAQQVLYDALSQRVSGLTERSMTPLGRSLDGIGHSWSGLMDRMSNSSALNAVATGVAKIVDGASWIIDHADRLADAMKRGLMLSSPAGQVVMMGSLAVGAMMAPTPAGASQADVRGVDQAIYVGYGAQAKGALLLADSYDTEGAKRRQLEGARSQLQGGLTGLDALRAAGQTVDEEQYQRIAAGLARVNEELAKLGQQQDGLQRYLTAAQKLDAVAQESLDTSEKKTRAELMLAQVEELYRTGQVKGSEATMEAIRATLGHAAALERLSINRQRDLQLSMQAARSYEDLTAKQEQATQVAHDYERATKQQVDQLRLEIQLEQAAASRETSTPFSLNRYQQIQNETQAQAANTAEREKAIEFRKIELELEVEMLKLGPESSAEKNEQIEKLYELEKARKVAVAALIDEKVAAQASRAAAAASVREWQSQYQRTADNIERSLTDAIMRGGKSGLDYLKDAFRTAILTPIISPIVRPVAGAISGVIQAGMAQLGFGPALPGGMPSIGGFGSFMGSAFGSSTPAFVGDLPIAEGLDASGVAASTSMGWAPWLAAGLQVMQGNYAGAGGGLAGAYAGSLIMPGIGTAVGYLAGSLLGDSLFGGDDGKIGDQGIGRIGNSIGQGYFEPLRGDWDAGQAAMNQAGAQIGAAERQLVANLNLTGTQLESVNQALAAWAGGGSYTWSGQSIPDWLSNGGTARIQADRLNVIAQALGRSVEELTAVMGMSTEQFNQYVDSMKNRQAQIEGAFRQLPAQLGITTLQSFQQSMATADYNAPLDRLSAARSTFEDTLAKAMAGDINAINALPGMGNTLLGIGRDVYASGTGFQDIKSLVDTGVKDVLDKQTDVLEELTKDLPDTIMQGSDNIVDALTKQTQLLIAEWTKLRDDINRQKPT